MGFAIAIKAGILAIFAGELGNEQAIEYIRYSWLNWIVAFLIVLAVLVLRRFLTWYINHRVLLVTKATASDDDDKFVKEMHKSVSWLLLFFAIWLAVLIIPIPDTEILKLAKTTYSLREVLQQISITLIIFFLARFLNWILEAIIYFAKRKAELSDTKIDDVLMPIIRDAIKVILWIFTALIIIQLWGFNITTLIAGLGIGGLAVAFAAQDTISNIFGSVTVLIDKPFEVGDWVKINDVEGVVEEVGMRSTRIRTFAKTQITLPNSKITSSVIENFSRMPIRRIKMRIGLAYWTTSEQMYEFVDESRKLLRTHPGVDQRYWLVYFDEFGSCDLSIFYYFFTKSTVWAEYLAVRQDVNLKLMKLAQRIGIDFAYPASVQFNTELKVARPQPGLQLDYMPKHAAQEDYYSGKSEDPHLESDDTQVDDDSGDGNDGSGDDAGDGG
ncbi:mechanosensitive ion channel family protein [bacterium]|nr:mechanosensitive ion channel family protein [bacterium]